MADKFCQKLGTGVLPLKIGKSFEKKGGNSVYHSIRYDFKPVSVDEERKGVLEVQENHSVSVQLPHIDGAGQTNYKGNAKPANTKDCILIIDHETGELTLERISNQIMVKKTRHEKAEKPSNYNHGASSGNPLDDILPFDAITLPSNSIALPSNDITLPSNPYQAKKEPEKPYKVKKEPENPYQVRKEPVRKDDIALPSNPYQAKKEPDNPYKVRKEPENPYAVRKEPENPYAVRKEPENPYAVRKEPENPYAVRKMPEKPRPGSARPTTPASRTSSTSRKKGSSPAVGHLANLSPLPSSTKSSPARPSPVPPLGKEVDSLGRPIQSSDSSSNSSSGSESDSDSDSGATEGKKGAPEVPLPSSGDAFSMPGDGFSMPGDLGDLMMPGAPPPSRQGALPTARPQAKQSSKSHKPPKPPRDVIKPPRDVTSNSRTSSSGGGASSYQSANSRPPPPPAPSALPVLPVLPSPPSPPSRQDVPSSDPNSMPNLFGDLLGDDLDLSDSD